MHNTQFLVSWVSNDGVYKERQFELFFTEEGALNQVRYLLEKNVFYLNSVGKSLDDADEKLPYTSIALGTYEPAKICEDFKKKVMVEYHKKLARVRAIQEERSKEQRMADYEKLKKEFG